VHEIRVLSKLSAYYYIDRPRAYYPLAENKRTIDVGLVSNLIKKDAPCLKTKAARRSKSPSRSKPRRFS
jgi:hypothetical protein